MSVWTICACFEARSEADSKKPSKQAHKCVSKKIENISRRFADCFAINFVPKWSACVNRLCRRWVLSNFDSYLLTTSYHASTFARNSQLFRARASGVRENRPMKAGIASVPTTKGFLRRFWVKKFQQFADRANKSRNRTTRCRRKRQFIEWKSHEI